MFLNCPCWLCMFDGVNIKDNGVDSCTLANDPSSSSMSLSTTLAPLRAAASTAAVMAALTAALTTELRFIALFGVLFFVLVRWEENVTAVFCRGDCQDRSENIARRSQSESTGTRACRSRWCDTNRCANPCMSLSSPAWTSRVAVCPLPTFSSKRWAFLLGFPSVLPSFSVFLSPTL